MTLEELVVLILFVWGLVYTTTASAIFTPFRIAVLKTTTRPLVRVFTYCPKCQSFWFGFAGGLVFTNGHPAPALIAAIATMGATAACAPLSAWATDAYSNELDAVALDRKEG